MARLKAIASTLARLRRDQRGAMAIETAIIAPVLVLMSLGSYQVSGLVSRQTELESAAGEGVAIALASSPDTAAKRTTVQQVLMASTGLPTANVTVSEVYRCNSATAYITDRTTCTSGVISTFTKIYLTDTYTPAWTRFGVGSAINYRVTRYAQYKQASVP